METMFETIQQIWTGFQHGQLPDLGTWNYMLVAVMMMFQGRLSAVLGGVAAAAGYLNLLPIILVALLARLVVDLFWYNVGSTGQVDRIGRHIKPYNRVANRVAEGINQRPRRYVFLAKLSNGLSLPVVVAAGNARVPYRHWLPVSFFAEFLWTLPLLLLGYFATDALNKWQGGLSFLTIGLTAVFLLAFAAYFVKNLRGANRQEN